MLHCHLMTVSCLLISSEGVVLRLMSISFLHNQLIDHAWAGETLSNWFNHLCSSVVMSGHILLERDLWREIFQGGQVFSSTLFAILLYAPNNASYMSPGCLGPLDHCAARPLSPYPSGGKHRQVVALRRITLLKASSAS